MEFGIKTMFNLNIFGMEIPITETITTTWIIMAILVVLSLLVSKNLEKIPGTFQNIMEMIVDGVAYLVSSTMGPDKMWFAPYILALLLYVALANLTGLIGVRQPTADLNTTFALSLMTFGLTQYYGIRYNGIGGYIKGFFQPLAFLFPLNIIGELSNPVSLGFRLFGNMLGGLIIMALIYSFAPIAIPVIPHLYFDVFAGLIQSFIFIMLTMTYIALAME